MCVSVWWSISSKTNIMKMKKTTAVYFSSGKHGSVFPKKRMFVKRIILDSLCSASANLNSPHHDQPSSNNGFFCCCLWLKGLFTPSSAKVSNAHDDYWIKEIKKETCYGFSLLHHHLQKVSNAFVSYFLVRFYGGLLYISYTSNSIS